MTVEGAKFVTYAGLFTAACMVIGLWNNWRRKSTNTQWKSLSAENADSYFEVGLGVLALVAFIWGLDRLSGLAETDHMPGSAQILSTLGLFVVVVFAAWIVDVLWKDARRTRTPRQILRPWGTLLWVIMVLWGLSPVINFVIENSHK